LPGGLGAGLGSPQEAFSFAYFFVAGGQRNMPVGDIGKGKKNTKIRYLIGLVNVDIDIGYRYKRKKTGYSSF
jgi:hypothetical protein